MTGVQTCALPICLEISDEEAEKIRTVKDAVEYIKAKLG